MASWQAQSVGRGGAGGRRARLRARDLGLLAAVLSALLAWPAASAHAWGSMEVKPYFGPPTTRVTAVGGIGAAKEPITIYFGSEVVATTKNESKEPGFETTFNVPSSAHAGVYTVTAEGMWAHGTVSAEFIVTASWPNARLKPELWGYDPYENLLSPGNVSSLSVQSIASWAGHVDSEPIYADRTVFAGLDDGTVRAFDPATGAQAWSFDPGGAFLGSPSAAFSSSAASGPGPCAIVAASAEGEVYGIDPADGAELWSRQGSGAVTSSPVSSGEEVLLAGDDGSLSELDACSGAAVWSASTDAAGAAQTPLVIGGVVLPDGSAHTIVVVCFSGELAAFDQTSGRQLWSEPDSGPPSSPAAYGSGTTARVVYASGSEVLERSAATGALVWSHETGAAIQGTVALDFKQTVNRKGVLKLEPLSAIAGNEAGTLLDLKLTNGKPIWTTRTPGAIGATSPAVADGVLYTVVDAGPGALEGTLDAFDVSSGALLSSSGLGAMEPGRPGAPSPSLADGRVLVGGFGGGMYVLGLAAGG